MALIGKIRKNSWLLIVVIGLALAAFIIMDMGSGNQGRTNTTTLATVNGKKIDYNEFSRTQQALYGGGSANNMYTQRDYAWNLFVEQAIMDSEFENLGLGVSMPEIMELEFGNNLSPVIYQQFTSPTTGQLDRNTLNQYRQILSTGDDTDPQIQQLKREWVYQRKLVVNDRMKTKLNSMVSKAIYTPSWMSGGGTGSNVSLSFEAVKVPFDAVADSEVSVSEADLQAYMKENANRFKQDEESRSVEYVVFNVIPTAKDSADIFKKLDDIMPAFQTAKNDTNFVRANQGVFGPEYVKRNFVNGKIVDSVFAMEVGSVVGPYLDNGQYRIAKVVDRKIIADSVESRHILFQARNQTEAQAAFALMDSIKTEIEAGRLDFATAASRWGTDATAQNGGDLGYSAPGRMVKPFNDLIFYHANPNKLYTIATQFGLHLVEVTGQKFETNEEGVRLAYIFEDIIPSEETQQEEYDRVYEFVRNNRTYETFKTSVENDPNLRMNLAGGIRKYDHSISTLGSNDGSRDMVKWMYDAKTKVNDVSNDIYVFKHPTLFYNNKFVVAALTGVTQGDIQSLDAVRDEVTLAVTNNKKAAILKERMAGKDLLQLSSEYNVDIIPVENVSFETSSMASLGREPKVLGAAYSLNVNDVSNPVQGEGGVYVVKLNNKVEGVAGGFAGMQNIAARNMKTQTNLRLWEALKDNAKIEDNRSTFF